jgi:hypothetical protein
MIDPILHSHIEDGLPDDHLQAWQQVRCNVCWALVHAGNNECMSTWVETGEGAFCIKCFANIQDVDVLEYEYGIATS